MLRRQVVPSSSAMACDAARNGAKKGMVSCVMTGDTTRYGPFDAALRLCRHRWQGKTDPDRRDRE
jgi:hypothetical protein